MFVVAIDACPIHACTVVAGMPFASQRQAAVWRRSWIRLPCEISSQSTARLTALACSRCPVAVTKTRSRLVRCVFLVGESGDSLACDEWFALAEGLDGRSRLGAGNPVSLCRLSRRVVWQELACE